MRTIRKYQLGRKASGAMPIKRGWGWMGPRGKLQFGTGKRLARLVWERERKK